MGCGASAEQSENEKKTDRSDQRSEATTKKEGLDNDTNAASRGGRSGVRESHASSQALVNYGSPGHNSLSPQSGQLSNSAGFVSASGSFSAPVPTMPTHNLIDSTGHRVTSCIGSRSKLESVTRWLDHIIRHKDPNAGWRNPQDDAGKEKPHPASAPGSVVSERSGAVVQPTHLNDSATASASQLSLNVPSTPGMNASVSSTGMRPDNVSNTPFSPQTPQQQFMSPSNADMAGSERTGNYTPLEDGSPLVKEKTKPMMGDSPPKAAIPEHSGPEKSPTNQDNQPPIGETRTAPPPAESPRSKEAIPVGAS